MTASLAPIRLLETLHAASSRGASDVHFCAGLPPVLRINGDLQIQSGAPATPDEIECMSGALLDQRSRDTYAASGDVTAAWRDGETGTFRVHAYRASRGPVLAVRLISQSVPVLASLHLPPIVETFAARPHGLIIFAGPTGSGKSTAMAALVDHINRFAAKHVITIEDPIEYEHRSNRSIVTQREIGRDVPAYSTAVHNALRCDPDVLLIGEMRDPSTIHAAITAAETGHLVLTTLHTGDAAQTVDRIIGAFSGEMQDQVRVQLAQTLAGIVCMRLVPRRDGRGRCVAAEVLIGNDAVRNVIRDGKTHQIPNIIATNRNIGMQSLEAHLMDLLARGDIATESAREVAPRLSEPRTSR